MNRPRLRRAAPPLWLLLAAAGAAPALARVFWRTPAGLHGATEAGRPGWAAAYEADYRINGGAARVEALGVAMDARTALAGLEAAYRDAGGETAGAQGETMGWGLARVGDRTIRYLAVPARRPGECVVFRIEQSGEAFRRSFDPPGPPRLLALPPPRDGRVTLYARNESRGTEIEIMETGRPAAVEARELARAAEAAGWRDPLARGPDGGGLRVVARGRDVGLLWVGDLGEGEGGARVVRMLARGAVP